MHYRRAISRPKSACKHTSWKEFPMSRLHCRRAIAWPKSACKNISWTKIFYTKICYQERTTAENYIQKAKMRQRKLLKICTATCVCMSTEVALTLQNLYQERNAVKIPRAQRVLRRSSPLTNGGRDAWKHPSAALQKNAAASDARIKALPNLYEPDRRASFWLPAPASRGHLAVNFNKLHPHPSAARKKVLDKYKKLGKSI